MLPPTPYVELSREEVKFSEEPTPKLLVLDLNGALVYRTAHTGASRKAYPRPFLNCFLQYVFLPEPEGGPRPWDVFVWSSAQPHNVRHMVETTIEREQRGEGRLLGVWARDKMNLGNDYNRKVQTTKDLRKIRDHFYDELNDSRFDESTMVLLDDSPLKAVYQPWSQIAIPEFDKPEYTASGIAAQRLNVRAAVRRVGGREGLRSQTAQDREQAVDPASRMANEPGLDNILLAVIGILEASRHVQNFPAWVRAGGIQRPGQDLEKVGHGDVTHDDLPSHASFEHWFANKDSHKYWVERGIEALKRKDIEVTHGLNVGAGGEATALGDQQQPAASAPRPSTPPPAESAPAESGDRQSTPPAPRPRPRRPKKARNPAPGDGADQAPGQGAAEDGGHEAQIAFNFLKSMADGNRRLKRGQQRILQRAVAILTELGYGPPPDVPADQSVEHDDGDQHDSFGQQWDTVMAHTPPPRDTSLPSASHQPHSSAHQSSPQYHPDDYHPDEHHPDDYHPDQYHPERPVELSHPADGMDVEPEQAAVDLSVAHEAAQQQPAQSTHTAAAGVHPDRLRELALNPPSPNAAEDDVDPGVAYTAVRTKRASDVAADSSAGPSKKPKVTAPKLTAPKVTEPKITAHSKPTARSMIFSPFPDNAEVRQALGVVPFYQAQPNAAGTVDSLLEADRSDIRFLRRLDDIGLEMTMAQAVAAELLLQKLVESNGYEKDKTTVSNVVALARHRLGLVVAPPGPLLDAVLAQYQDLELPDKQPSKRPVKPNALTRSGRHSMARAQAQDEPLFMSFDDLLRFSGRPIGKAAVALHKATVAKATAAKATVTAAANPKTKGKAVAGKATAKSTAKVAAKAAPAPKPKAPKKKGGYDTRQQTEANTLPLANRRQWNAEA
ncbi:hypothetical protein VHUM_01798 [Vanrija humicola]|uniref:FCP1 homology domain-containing protein n=1 Tax=Vanrija humicola TaxID=5417 RepID=A0A7D8V0M5_VANHU|nr:hypothetical protein VHUM_01798 [Vanrija humicola]